MRAIPHPRWSTPSLLGVMVALGALGYIAGRLFPAPPASPARTAIASTLSPADSAAPNAAAGPAAPRPAPQSGWNEILGQASTPARNRQLAAFIEDLAKTDPQRALALAQSVADWRLRDLLRNAALRGWATVQPEAAADWALAVRPEERRAVIEAVMQGAAANPPAAVRVALRLCSADPERGGDYGHYTIAALVDAGAFEAAVQFGTEVDPDKYPFLLKSALFQWARNQPTEALAALEKIPDPVLRSKARGEVIAGWAWADAEKLAAYGRALPAGSDRAEVLAEALPRWVEKDPDAALAWIHQSDNSPDFDAGIVALAHTQTLVVQQPKLAMDLAGGVANPAERDHTMRAVFRQWAQNDPGAARQFINTLPAPEDRARLTNELKDLSPDG